MRGGEDEADRNVRYPGRGDQDKLSALAVCPVLGSSNWFISGEAVEDMCIPDFSGFPEDSGVEC